MREARNRGCHSNITAMEKAGWWQEIKNAFARQPEVSRVVPEYK